MTLLNAPDFDERKENRKRNILLGSGISVAALALLTLAGFLLGHGWLFFNLPAEHKVKVFLTTVESGDYPKAYALWNNDPNWQQHPEKYTDYPLQRFTEDFSTQSTWKGKITSFQVGCSKRDATGTSVATTINGTDLTLKYIRSDGTLSFFPLDLKCGLSLGS
jgi:hypothetical protein